ncbi:hypothetical protein [Streptomyces sp. NPDC101150]|uniref:hypothetical protein n=1 Tax=Streptomyces sp. NPDC101150 TaxID=3366114 RepID=UPI00382F2774
MTAGTTRGIAVFGGGSLARHLCYSLATATDPPPGKVTVLARSPQAAAEIAAISNTRASISASPTRFAAEVLDATDRERTARLLERIRPRAVVNCASLQSPWEGNRFPSAWTALLTEGGFGIGLPLHAVVAREVAGAVELSGLPTLFVNASYPDAVNPLLYSEGLPVLCGVGNAATLSASLRAALGPWTTGQRLRLLAHHLHLHAPADPADELRAWLDDRPVQRVGELLTAQRSCSRAELNALTGHAAAAFVTRLAADQDIRADVPGPLGLPGGYPVRVHGGRIALDLPAGLTQDEAVAWQMRMSEQDGVVVRPDGEVRFGEQARKALAAHLPDLPERHETGSMRELARRLLNLREQLSGRAPLSA